VEVPGGHSMPEELIGNMRRMIHKMLETRNQERLVAFGLFLLLFILLAPLLWIAKYNVMAVDDYKYLNIARSNMQGEGWNLFSIAFSQARNAFDCWKTWQGQYFANWSIMTFLALGGDENYFCVTLITLIPLLLADFMLIYILLKKGFGATFSEVCIAALPVMIFHMSVPASLVEAYYWLSGAVTYTTVYAISLASTALLTDLLFLEGKKRKVLVYAIVLALSVCMGGGNLVTGLFMVLVFFFFALYAFAAKKRQCVFYLVNFLVYTATFLLTIFSPGVTNRRMENIEHQVPALKAVFLSLFEAAKYVRTWTQPYVILLLIALIPLFWKILKKRNYRFPLPGLVILISFGMYAAQFMPNQYALGILGAYRVQNIYRFQLIFWLLANEFYILGYLQRRFPSLKNGISDKIKKVPFITAVYGTMAVCITFGCMYCYVGNTMSSVSAYKSIRDGSAQGYYQEYQERLAILKDDAIKDVVFKPYYYCPYALYFDDFQRSYNWINEDAAQIYHKNSIIIQE